MFFGRKLPFTAQCKIHAHKLETKNLQDVPPHFRNLILEYIRKKNLASQKNRNAQPFQSSVLTSSERTKIKKEATLQFECHGLPIVRSFFVYYSSESMVVFIVDIFLGY